MILHTGWNARKIMINNGLDQKPLVTDDGETYGPSVEDSSNNNFFKAFQLISTMLKLLDLCLV